VYGSRPSGTVYGSRGGTVYGSGHVTSGHYATMPSGSSRAPMFRGNGYPNAIGGAHIAGNHTYTPPVVADRHGYLGGGHGWYAPNHYVPVFTGGHYGRAWWGPHYGWRVPTYWGWYYRPYPAYWGVGYWVTDWVMLDLLAAEEAYLLTRPYGYAPVVVESVPMDTGVREELRAQIDENMDGAPAGDPVAAAPGNTLVVNDPRIARALASPHHVFVVTRDIQANDITHGGTCNLTRADLIRSSAPIPSGQSMAEIAVAASKKTSCAAGSIVTVPIADLVRFEQDLLERVGKGAAAARNIETQPEPEPPGPDAVQQQMPNADDVPEAEELSPATNGMPNGDEISF
jgi:hypothetical protein